MGNQVPILRHPGTELKLVADARWTDTVYWEEHDPHYITALQKWAGQLGAQVAALKRSGLEDIMLTAEGFPVPFERVMVITSFGQPSSCIVDAVRGMSARGVKVPIIGAGAYPVKYAQEPLEALGYHVSISPNSVLQVSSEVLGSIGKSAELYSTLFVAVPK
ncbi:hypothetical protein HYU17_04305 [Candidatus Woesearchaeota archaeon]|nr:hypothetical protein [Candidatus Woesearchaeota archaeon]